MTIRVEHVVPYIGDGSSDPARSVPALCSALIESGTDVRLRVLGLAPNRTFNFQVQEYRRHLLPHKRLLATVGGSGETNPNLCMPCVVFTLILPKGI